MLRRQLDLLSKITRRLIFSSTWTFWYFLLPGLFGIFFYLDFSVFFLYPDLLAFLRYGAKYSNLFLILMKNDYVHTKRQEISKLSEN